MTKADLVKRIAAATGLSAVECTGFLNAFVEAATEELKGGGEVLMQGFGRLYVRKRKERTGRNPRTGAELKIPACNVASFTSGKALKEALNK